MMPKTKKLKDKVNTRDSYNTYKVVSNNPISVVVYCRILNGFFKYIMQLVLEGHEVKLPQLMGSLYIRATKPKIGVNAEGKITGAAIDWKSTIPMWNKTPGAREAKKYIYFLNEHTNGLRYSIKWFKSKINAENIHLYSFQLTKTNKTEIAELVRGGKEYYTEVLYGQ